LGYDILITLMLMVLVPLVILGFVVFWSLVSRERAAIEDCWSSWARSRRHEYVPARGSWPNRSSPAVRWLEGDVPLMLSVVGAEANARTRLVAWPRGKLLGSFVVDQRLGRAEATDGIDDAAFGTAFRISSRPRGLGARALDLQARRALLGFWQRDDVVLVYRRGKVILEWPGRESNDARLDEAARVMVVLARGVNEAFSHPASSASTLGALNEQHAE
jgi:hypothetical protein